MAAELTDQLEQFRAHVDRLFVKPDDNIGLLLHAAVGVAGEAGELLDAIKKSWIYGKELDRENLLEEAGDCLFYVTALLIHSGFTLEKAMDHNIAKLAKRYPQGYTDQAARERADKQEPLQVQAGKFYQRRDGKVVGPTRWCGGQYFRAEPYNYNSGGTLVGFERQTNDEDLIREVPMPSGDAAGNLVEVAK